MKIEFNNKYFKLFSIILVLIMLIIIILTSLFNFYPGGYSFETSNNEVFIEKGALKKEAYNFTITKYNEPRIGLLEINIDELKRMWYLMTLFMTFTLITSSKYFRFKNNKNFIVSMIGVFLIMIILLSIPYINSINNIESIILKLK
ncbi:hypothetical protein MKX62_24520 [Sporosarcina sp. FSL K6-5500]